MELRKIGFYYSVTASILSLVMAYSISTISPNIGFLTMFSSLFLVLVLMKLVTLFLIKNYIIDKIQSLKDEVSRFNYTKVEKLPSKYEGSCNINMLANAIYEYQNKNLNLVQTLERDLEQQNDMLRENQYYIEHLESAILKNKKDKGESEDEL